MVQEKARVITPERFAQGLDYHEYVANVERNQKRFEENYAGTSVPQDLADRLKALMAKPNGPAKLIVIGEDWCPDVFRGAPVFARIAEATGLEMKFFPRDQNKDIMANYLNGGEFESIPVAVFFTKDFDEIAHWIERPAKANAEMRELAPMYARLRKPDKTPEEAEQAKQEYIAFQNGPIWGGWRDETIKEITELLEAKVA